MKKILIFGFPHCGTSILKSIIAHNNEVYEIVNETLEISSLDIEKSKKMMKKFIIIKYPNTRDEFFTEKYNDYHKIFILRNPLYVFTSLNKRYKDKIKPEYENLYSYIDISKKFNKLKQNNNINNLYFIKYEELFDNNYEKIKKILTNIGINWTDEIFDNKNYTNQVIKGTPILNYKPDNIQHKLYRTWQINQPFENMNNEIDITEGQKKLILNNEVIRELYPDIRECFESYNKLKITSSSV